MNRFICKNVNCKIIFFAAMLWLLALTPATTAFAWGPERPTYTMEKPADHVVFNSIIDNAAIGDERNFVRIAERTSDGKTSFVNDIELEPGKDYVVYIYYHNNASATFNDGAHGHKGVAFNTKMSTAFPDKLAAGETGQVYGAISSPEASPGKVWDEANITAINDITLHYVLGSAKIFNSWKTNGSIMPSYIFSESGTYLGMDELNGMIFGCDEYSGSVMYDIRTKAADFSKDNPGSTDVRTGDNYAPIVIILAAFVPAISIIAIIMVLRHKK